LTETLKHPVLEQPAASERPIQKQNVSVGEGLKVVRLLVRAGHVVPEHHSNVDVVVTVVRGEGRFTVEGDERPIAAGGVVVMRPGARHAIAAATDLELVVVHARLAGGGEAAGCGA
jgi:quercetin dioxygenase-like cupin family protein